MNQCDGCRAGIPVIDGKHRMGTGPYADYMWCTKDRYIIGNKRKRSILVMGACMLSACGYPGPYAHMFKPDDRQALIRCEKACVKSTDITARRTVIEPDGTVLIF